MSFGTKNKDEGNNKQHLNLSTTAYDVVQNDMFAFGEDKLSSFLNTIFEHYYPIAEASISRTLSEFNGELCKALSDISADECVKKRILDELLLKKGNELVAKAEAYNNGKALKFWLNKRNLEYLNEPYSECDEDKYYTRRGKYIKSVIEEYACLPYIERERVFFRPFINSIEYAICEECQVRIVTDKDMIYSVYPYKVLRDPLSTANYLVGFCKLYNCSENDKKRPGSFRISALKSVRVEKSKSAFLKKSDQKELLKLITSHGVQFLAGNEAEVHVRLTKDGVHKLRRQTHLRPPLVNKYNDVYVFQCTTAQAEFYFFKFGSDVEILLPIELRNRFRTMYETAFNTYVNQRRL